MSLDLSWSLLDESFTTQLLASLDKVLCNASKPDFIGPISITALDLGSEAPEISIIDIGDVWQGFLDRRKSSNGADKATRRANDTSAEARNTRRESTRSDHQQDQFARFAEKNLPFTALQNQQNGKFNPSARQKPSNRLQTFRQYSNSVNAQLVETGSVSSYDPPSSIPQTPASSQWGPGLMPMDRPFPSRNSSAGGYFPAWQGAQHLQMLPTSRPQSWRRSSASVIPNHASARPSPMMYPNMNLQGEPEPSTSATPSTSTSMPSLQAKLMLRWNTSSLRIKINTSLLINHPSPAFMSLPLSITITGLVLQAGGMLAFEVDEITNVRKGHFCLVAEEIPEEAEGQEVDVDDLGHDIEVEDTRFAPMSSNRMKHSPAASATLGNGVIGNDQDLTPGEKILPMINLETSVGQADKHSLRNVAKVEKFVASLVRKAIGDELVFPNFYSIELPKDTAAETEM